MAESEADKIRARRLAKLGGGAPATPSQSSPQSGASSPSATSTPKPPQETPAQTPPAAQNAAGNPFSQLGIKPESNQSSTKINITPASATSQSRDGEGASRPKPRQQAPSESVESWEDRQLSNIFRLSLEADIKRDTAGQTLHLLPSLREDLEDQKEPLLLKTALLDQALTEAASKLEGERPLDYLLGCWKRVSRAVRQARSGDPNSPRYAILKEAKRLCMSYCIFAVTMPEMFGQDTPAENALAQHLLVDPESETGLCHDFLTEAVSRFEEDESIKDALVGAAEQLSRELSKMSMIDNVGPYIQGWRVLVRYPKMIQAIAESPNFLPQGVAAQDIETNTTLGPLFRLSPTQEAVAKSYFSSPKTRDRGYILTAQRATRMTLSTHQDALFEITNQLIKNGKESRERMLDWFALCVNSNHKRRATMVDPRFVSSDGFMINVTACLDRLCDPFMDASFSKIEKIDVNYLKRNPRVSIKDETKINADQKTADEYFEQQAEGTSNFISEIFFLTLAGHQYGSEAAAAQLSTKQKQVKQMDRDVEMAEAERHKVPNDPRYLARFDAQLERLKERVDSIHSIIHATQGILLDELVQARSMQFMRYVIVWLLRLASGQNLPKEKLRLPLPEGQPEIFRYLPQYFVEDIVDNFKFITRNLPHIITSTQSEELVSICITFLRNTEYIQSPYLKAGLVTILFHGVWPLQNYPKGVLGDQLNGSPFAHKNLLHALMRFYIEAESTGTHTQFYDKFNIRYEIFQVFKCIWGNVMYRENLAKEATVNTEFFVRFVNLLLNDVTFVLDEVFSSFTKIHDLQQEFKRTPPETMEETERKEKEELLADTQNKVKSYMGLMKESVAMLKLFTDALAGPFTMPEIVQRLADMLDYNLDTMVGPKQKSLVVEGPEQYGWSPKDMLSDLVDVYLNLRHKPSFHIAVARDGRSYKQQNFDKAMELMARFGRKSKDQLAEFAELAAAVAAAHAEDVQAEEDLGEVPDELLDPIMGSLMLDPVMLPASRQVVDRSTIRSHLLSDATDPFNRMPLRIEDVLPAEEKKREIEAFIASRKKGGGGGVDAMDTSQG